MKKTPKISPSFSPSLMQNLKAKEAVAECITSFFKKCDEIINDKKHLSAAGIKQLMGPTLVNVVLKALNIAVNTKFQMHNHDTNKILKFGFNTSNNNNDFELFIYDKKSFKKTVLIKIDETKIFNPKSKNKTPEFDNDLEKYQYQFIKNMHQILALGNLHIQNTAFKKAMLNKFEQHDKIIEMRKAYANLLAAAFFLTSTVLVICLTAHLSPEIANAITSQIGAHLNHMDVAATALGGAALASGAGFILHKCFMPSSFAELEIETSEGKTLKGQDAADYLMYQLEQNVDSIDTSLNNLSVEQIAALKKYHLKPEDFQFENLSKEQVITPSKMAKALIILYSDFTSNAMVFAECAIKASKNKQNSK